MRFHQETEVAVFTEIRGQENFRRLAVQLPAGINIRDKGVNRLQIFFFARGGGAVVLPATASCYCLAPHLLHAEVRYDRRHLRHQHGFIDCAVGGRQHAVLTPGVRAVERRVETRRAWKGGSCHAWGMSAASKRGKWSEHSNQLCYQLQITSHLDDFFTISRWIMKHSYLRAAMLDNGEWIREWYPGEDVVILLWWLCKGLQWRGGVVPTVQLHGKRRKGPRNGQYWDPFTGLTDRTGLFAIFY